MDIKNFKQFLFESDEEDKFLKDLASMLKEELETFLHPFRGKIHGTKYGI